MLQSHLYSQFLTGSAADVTLHVQGSWEAVYQLHRVVLIQAGYFSSLFSGGFLESQRTRRSAFVAPDEVMIRFDDPNITRAAFELCIARLYGGGPPLHVSPALIPTATSPLTPAFSAPASASRSPTPVGRHNATPRFLLSLLATAAFLSIPLLINQSLDLILGSVGPYTVLRYLRFAIGLGIGEPEPGERESPVGLENVGQKATTSFQRNLTLAPTTSAPSLGSDEGEDDTDMAKKLGEVNLSRDGSEVSISETASTIDEETAPIFNYGRISEKVGEACVCFLTRWSVDILPVEEAAADQRGSLDQTLLPAAPTIWARGGLSARWVKALISSDDFFVKGELERYDFACRVVELRRRRGILSAEETEWEELFRTGIYYTSIHFDDLTRISQDVSPTTRRAYVPHNVLHSAHWTHSMLRSQVMTRPPVSGGSPSSSPSPAPRERELRFCLTTAEIAAQQAALADRGDKPEEATYFPVLSDTSMRIGNPPAHQPAHGEPTSHFVSNSQRRTGFAQEFFGLKCSRHTAAEAIAADPSGKARWSPYPPFRFGVEFWNVVDLDQKIFSHTIWYAGSLFNVYAQLVRKKGVQLGVYLHRQSSVETMPRPSSPPAPPAPMPSSPTAVVAPRPESWSGAPGSSSTSIVTRPGHTSHFSLGGRTRADSGGQRARAESVQRVSSPLSSARSTMTTPAPVQPFRDPRATVFVYFGISCFVLPAALIRFTSS
ncbi:hypothetical protein EXIGLDRAFT_672006, partial [Exidia glandulosa HHB12029]